jgi:glutaredoxin
MSDDPPRSPPRLSRRELLTLGALVLAVTGLSTWWQQHVADGQGPAVAKLARPGDIHMVSSVTCLYCTRAREWFARHEVPISECFIERDAACDQQFRALMAPGTPLLLVRGQAQVGFSPERVLKALQDG